MKFRAVATKHEAIQQILKSFLVCTKFTAYLIIRISSTSIQIIADPSYENGPLLSRCELLRDTMFSEYSFHGISNEDNLIFFDVRSDSISNILQALRGSFKSLKLKLVNNTKISDKTDGNAKRFAMTLTVEYSSLVLESRKVTHNVSITLMNRSFWNNFTDQPLDPIQVCAN